MESERVELPKGWEWRKLAEVLADTRGGTWGIGDNPLGVAVLRPNNIGFDGEVIFDDLRFREVPQRQLETQRLATGEVILTKSNSIEQIGRCAYFVHPRDGRDYVASNFLQKLRFEHQIVVPRYAFWYLRSEVSREYFQSKAKGSSASLKNLSASDMRLLDIPIPFPGDVEVSRAEQNRVVARIEEFSAREKEIQRLRDEMEAYDHQVLLNVYQQIIEDAAWMPFIEVAPLIRRLVPIAPDQEYYELGIRSFGKGTFHKPAVLGSELVKKIYWMEPEDLIFNNVFAWEGAVAVARPEDHGRVGSHRFLTCVPKEGLAKSSFLRFHFLTKLGLQQLGEASPGTAGRNRTLAINRLAKIQVPVPPYEKQCWFDALQAKLDQIRRAQMKMEEELDALMPSVLAKAFSGEL